tara:strand:- start:130 stop:363 length:234 start_codon:yes stop_codon:yes gene_type:complete
MYTPYQSCDADADPARAETASWILKARLFSLVKNLTQIFSGLSAHCSLAQATAHSALSPSLTSHDVTYTPKTKTVNI